MFKSLLFLVHVSEFPHSDIILKLWVELDFCSFQIKIALNFKSQGTEKTNTFLPRDLRLCFIANYECVKISRIAVMDIKLWIKEDLDLHTNNLWSSLKFIHPKVQSLCKIFSSFSHNFISNKAKLKIFAYS